MSMKFGNGSVSYETGLLGKITELLKRYIEEFSALSLQHFINLNSFPDKRTIQKK